MADKKDQSTESDTPKQTCGIIMPISPTDGYTPLHWADVKKIIDSVIVEAGFIANLVSDADDVGIIHNRIVKNLAENPIVICDVSSKNPNVMFELGLRLAFDKATIIIKDELTAYNFDTSPIEHLSYPSDLHFHQINDFKQKLKAKLLKTFEASKDPKYSTFLKNFVNYKRELQTEEISNQDYIIKQFDRLFDRISRLEYINDVTNHKSQVLFENIIASPDSIRRQLSILYQEFKKNVEFDSGVSTNLKRRKFIEFLVRTAPEFTDKYTITSLSPFISELFDLT